MYGAGDRPETTDPDLKLVYAAIRRDAGVAMGKVACGAGGLYFNEL